MKTIIIAALSENRVIGRDNGIPWNYPADVKHFIRTTKGYPVVAGRKTYESFKVRPLPNRFNIILTRNPDYRPDVAGRTTYTFPEGHPSSSPRLDFITTRNLNYPTNENVVTCQGLAQAVEQAKVLNAEKLFIIGGAEIYEQALPLADEMILTHLPIEVEGDAYFPAWDEGEWEVVERRCEGELVFATYRRRR